MEIKCMKPINHINCQALRLGLDNGLRKRFTTTALRKFFFYVFFEYTISKTKKERN